MRILRYGEGAVLVELEDLAQVHALHRAVLAAGWARESVPGAQTLMVVGEGDLPDLIAALDVSEAATGAVTHEISVTYDGDDLVAVADACGLSVDEVVRLHSSVDYVVGFLGFARGFPYLMGLPSELHLPRRASPRTAVPAGSVAIASDMCGIYPTAAPGGWHLLGRTDAVLFDDRRDPPTLLQPGDVVRFR